MNTVTVTIDDSLPSRPGNWLALPESAVPLWQALTLAERNQVLAGHGHYPLVEIIHSLAISDADAHGI